MKKLLLTLLITLSTTILAKTPESLFGIYINDNVLDYVTKEELKSKRKDRARGFYSLILKNPPLSNKDFTDKLYVSFDKNNKIVKIQSDKVFQTFENCKNVGYRVRKGFENKYDIEFVTNLNIKYGFDKWVGDNQIAIQCLATDNVTYLLIFLQTEKYKEKYDEYFYSNI